MLAPPTSPSLVTRINVGEVQLQVTEYPGDGPTLFLLHGIGSREMTWWPVIDQLTSNFRLVIPDLRGHGGSDKPKSGYHVDDYARDLDGLLAAYGAEHPKLVGHSLGGMVALAWARRKPDRAECIVLEDSPMRNRPNAGELFTNWMALATSSIDEAAGFYKSANPTWTDDECRRRAESITLTAQPVFEEMRNRSVGKTDDRIAASAAIISPVLLVHGDVDTGGMVEQEDAHRFVATLPRATAVRIPGGSHSLHRDYLDAFLAATVPFLLEPRG